MRARVQTRPCTRACKQRDTHAHTRARARARAHTHTHTHTHMLTCPTHLLQYTDMYIASRHANSSNHINAIIASGGSGGGGAWARRGATAQARRPGSAAGGRKHCVQLGMCPLAACPMVTRALAPLGRRAAAHALCARSPRRRSPGDRCRRRFDGDAAPEASQAAAGGGGRGKSARAVRVSGLVRAAGGRDARRRSNTQWRQLFRVKHACVVCPLG